MGVCPLPCGRTIERVLQRNGLTAPSDRLAATPPGVPRGLKPTPAGGPGAVYFEGRATATPSGWEFTPLLEPNLEIDQTSFYGYRAAETSHPWGTCAS
jgi:hypothetical protein